jgi:hypothetical protein
MDFLDLAATNWGFLRFVAAFVALPFLYLKDSAEVHKDFAESFTEKDTRKCIECVKERLYVFQLDWWLIIAVFVFLLGVSLLGEVAASSKVPAGLGLSAQQLKDGKDLARGIVNAFSIVLALSSLYYVQWCKARAYQDQFEERSAALTP